MAGYLEDLHYVRNAGVDMFYASDLYHPGGYPRLRLAPVATELSQKSTSLLRNQLQRAEAARGHHLAVHGLHHLDPRFANELVAVYLGLAEQYPAVYVGGIDFCDPVNLDASFQAFVLTPPGSWPTLFERSKEIKSRNVTETLRSLRPLSATLAAQIEKELTNLGSFRRDLDLTSHGTISFGPWTSRPRVYEVANAYPGAVNHFRSRVSTFPRYVDVLVSAGAAILVHEFGHVVEQALTLKGLEAEEYVFTVLDEIYLRYPSGGYVIPASTLRAANLTRNETRLVNYPRAKERHLESNTREVVLHVVGDVIKHSLNRYSSLNRDELFAETFFIAHCAKDPALRAKLKPFLDALYDVGLARKRRHAYR